MSTATAAAPKSAGEIAFEYVVNRIKEDDMAEGGTCVAAGLAKNVLSQARGNGCELSLGTIEKFAAFWKIPVGDIIGEPATRVDVPERMIKRLGIPTEQVGSLTMISLGQIGRSNLNPRKTFDEVAIAELADSIAARGLLQNLVVARIMDAPAGLNQFYIVAGERRWRAMTKLQEEGRLPAALAEGGIPCKVVEGARADNKAMALVENLQRQDMNPMEEAQGFADLHAIDPVAYSTKWMAETTGFSQRYIQLRLQLVKDLIPETQAALREGKITLANARALTIAPAKQQKDLLKNGAAMNYKADQLKNQITGQWKLCSFARFDWTVPELAQYIVVDEGTEWFKDAAKFKELQEAAVAKLMADAEGKFAWVERQSWFSQNEYQAELVSPATRGGCLIVVDYQGHVFVHEGLVKKRTGDHRSAEDVRREQMLQQLVNERFEAYGALSEQLQAKIRPRDAIMLILFDLLCENYGELAGPLEGSVIVSEGLISGPLKRLAGSVGKRPHYGNAIQFKPNTDLGTAWTVMDGLTDEELAEAITRATTPAVRLSTHKPLHPAYIAIAKRHDIDVPPILLMTEDEKKAEIARRMAQPADQLDIEDAIGVTAAAAA